MEKDNGKRFVNTLLDPSDFSDLEDIRAFYGIKSRSDVIRLLIRAEVRRLNADASLFASGGRRDSLS